MSNTLKLGNGKWATGKDTVLSFSDTNNNYKPLPFSFSRDTSATVINKDGLIETVGSGEPRIDFKDNTKGALLLEPSRSNFIPNSNNLTTWNGAAMTRTFVDDLINPSSILGGSKLTQTSSGGYAWLSRTFTGNETFSAFVKKDSSDFVRLYAANNTVYFNIVNGTIETEVGSDITDKSIVNYGNGWFRISMSVNSTIASYVRIYPASSGSSASGTNSLFVYGCQVEQGSYATSYIPTSGQSGGVTRVQDLVVGIDTLQDLSLLGSNEGTWLVDMKDMFFEITGTGVGSMYLYQDNTNQIEFVAKSNTTCKITINNSTALDNIGGENKIAISWDANGLVIYKNGVAAYTTSSTEYSNPYTHLFLVRNTRQSKKQINNTQLYNTRLSNSELAALTQ
uniref:Uncharacterized protein n=1 Tax=uncultured marine virus TaxID=186617 RepID=A0A0F7L7M8_9VIRU|nr:hypothetical protein P12024S_10 [uncultured marine virus]